MIKYCIMALLFGYSGNKLFGKDKSINKSLIVASITAIILIIINVITILI